MLHGIYPVERQTSLVSKRGASVGGNASSMCVWWSQLLCSEAGPWLGQREVRGSSSFVGHKKGRSSPSANSHEQGAHFPAWLCQCWRQIGQETLQLTLYCWDLPSFSPTSCLCPEKCENLISWMFPSWLPARGGESQYHSPAASCPQLITLCQHKVREAGWFFLSAS